MNECHVAPARKRKDATKAMSTDLYSNVEDVPVGRGALSVLRIAYIVCRLLAWFERNVLYGIFVDVPCKE
jgi:hypothetical protein